VNLFASRLGRAAAAVALVGGGLLAGSTMAGAAPAAPDQQAAERATMTHPDLDYMGWTTRGAPAQAGSSLPPRALAVTQTPGIDVSHYQGNTDWAGWWNQGKRFAWVKATEGTTYRDPSFSYQYTGSYNVGMLRGSYHFALPGNSSGAAQANYFVDHGGGWSADGRTLPGTLDIEYNPYGATCYGLSQASMVNWIRDFTNTYRARTGRDAVIYTATSWWSTCTGNNGSFGATNPLWIARYSSSPGTLPNGWGARTVWQYTSSPLDQDYFNGAYDRLQALANG
jgi:GH25 family lysozyme M1 (1,4-beta-N-acetylmuramidase)